MDEVKIKDGFLSNILSSFITKFINKKLEKNAEIEIKELYLHENESAPINLKMEEGVVVIKATVYAKVKKSDLAEIIFKNI